MVIITGNAHEYLMNSLLKNGYQVHYAPEISYEELSEIIPAAEGLIVTTRLQIDKTIIDKAENLKWIGRLGSGLELIDTAYAEKKNITWVSSPEGNRNAVAEHALGMLLNLLNNITKAAAEVKEGLWVRDANRGIELSGKTIGIIGYGNTGQALAKLLSAFDVTILVYDKYKQNFGGKEAREANMEQICRYADVISFHVPLTTDTTNMADESFFNALLRKPVIINTSRGAVINTNALVNAIKSYQVSGAALDVLENENIKNLSATQQELFNFLCSHNQVLLTPHIAGYSQEAFLKMSQILLKKLGIN